MNLIKAKVIDVLVILLSALSLVYAIHFKFNQMMDLNRKSSNPLELFVVK